MLHAEDYSGRVWMENNVAGLDGSAALGMSSLIDMVILPWKWINRVADKKKKQLKIIKELDHFIHNKKVNNLILFFIYATYN